MAFNRVHFQDKPKHSVTSLIDLLHNTKTEIISSLCFYIGRILVPVLNGTFWQHPKRKVYVMLQPEQLNG
jgi:hypothetical protein